jgi:hypothetical protein
MKKINSIFLFLAVFAFSNSAFSLSPSLTQGNYRWRSDDGNEANATWKGAQNTPITIQEKSNIRLRIELYNTNNMSASDEINLAYAQIGESYSLITNDASTNHFVLSPSNNISDLEPTTNQLLLTDGNVYATGGIMVESSTGNILEISDYLQSKEIEYCIRPTDKVLPNTTYYFVVRHNDGSALWGYDRTITLTTGNMGLPTSIIKQAPTGKMTIYQNATTEGFYIQADIEPTTLFVYNTIGEIVKTQIITNKGFVNISDLPKGIYIVVLGENTQKIIKK